MCRHYFHRQVLTRMGRVRGLLSLPHAFVVQDPESDEMDEAEEARRRPPHDNDGGE